MFDRAQEFAQYVVDRLPRPPSLSGASFQAPTLRAKKSRSVLFVGLDGAGKTSLLSHVANFVDPRAALDAAQAAVHTEPTVGLRMYDATRDAVRWTLWDMSGQGRYRSLWQHYVGNVQAMVFVIDASDVDRVAVVRDELHALLEHPALRTRKLPLFLAANKADLNSDEVDEFLDVETVELVLQTDSLKEKFRVRVAATSGLSGAGVDDMMRWLADSV